MFFLYFLNLFEHLYLLLISLFETGNVYDYKVHESFICYLVHVNLCSFEQLLMEILVAISAGQSLSIHLKCAWR